MKNNGRETFAPLKLNFRPHRLIRHPHLQTIFPALYPSRTGTRLRQSAQELILEVENGVRLLGYYSPQVGQRPKGVVLLLHGWLGSVHSNYSLRMGEYLFQRGYAVFRLNFRDHGDSYALNQGIFRSDLLDEVVAAARQVAQFEQDCPFYVIGVSLGGNFALRVAWHHTLDPIPNLTHTIAVCPVIGGHQTTLALDDQPLYLTYFRRKWRKMLRQKMAAFPEVYDFSEELAAQSCLAMTEAFIRRYSPYPDALAYFESYRVTTTMMAALGSPTSIIAAADDPIIPASDFLPFFNLTARLHIYLQAHGGHVGFMDIFPCRIWLCEAILTILEGR